MKKLISLILLLLSFQSILFAQGDRRAQSTKIADLLAKFPVQNKYQQNNLMQEMAALGGSGLLEMTMMLSAQGKGDNTRLQYALNGYTSYVSLPGNEKQKAEAVKTYCQALSKMPDALAADFIIQQLQLIGKDDAVACLKPLLTNSALAGNAARALAQINTPLAEKTLMTALKQAKGKALLSVIEALGYAKYSPAVKEIIALTKSTDANVAKVSLYALASIGDTTASGVLEAAAAKQGYRYDQTGATAAYLNYIREVSNSGRKDIAATFAEKLMNNANGKDQLPVKVAAMQLLAEAKGDKALPVLYDAAKSEDVIYRTAALRATEKMKSPGTKSEWLKQLSSASPGAAIQLLNYLGKSGDPSLMPELQKYLSASDEGVRLAAINSVALTGKGAAIPVLINQLKNSGEAETNAVKNALLGIPSADISIPVLNDFDAVPDAGKVSLIEVLAARKADKSAGKIIGLANGSSQIVRTAAVKALPSVVSANDQQAVFNLVKTASPANIPYLQQAMSEATSGMKDTAARSTIIIKQMRSESVEKQIYYLEVLAGIGGSDAYKAISQSFSTGNDQAKAAAVAALSKSTFPEAPLFLLNIARQNTSGDIAQQALNGYIDLVAKNNYPPDQKVLMLIDAMALTTNDGQRQRILRETARIRTFPALVFAGQWLDTTAVQQQAANAVMRIALSDKSFNGPIVEAYLNKCIQLLSGQDSDYEKKAIRAHLAELPKSNGFEAMFNGKDLTGWKGLVGNPHQRATMPKDTLLKKQAAADKLMREGWAVKDGLLIFTGHGDNLATEKMYGDFEMFVDWKITPQGDAGIYLRGTPQVQIWDTTRRDVGAQVGSGGLYNNQKNSSKPLVVADNAIGEWNNFHIIMKGDKVTVYLNGKLVVDQVQLENYWDRSLPIFAKEQIELQAHGTYVAYRNIYIKEITRPEPFKLSTEEINEGYKVLFDGSDLSQWVGNVKDYVIEGSDLVVKPGDGSGGNLFTKDEYGDFVFRFEFQLTPGANNGLGIRAPLEGDAAYTGMELQILDNEAEIYKNLKPYQYHGSVYGVIPAKRGYLKPLGEWNYEEVTVRGTKIKVVLNNEVILDGDIADAGANGTMDKQNHPGLKRAKGHIGFLGHGSVVRFRNIRVKSMD
ncbi:DUF1080 domain-containing protein [Pollutibacter soli]|uniref:DUF1080 domain-containing protein n=1 Tax=Pollutibacter soli TaxID=3034157 RepID=UPI003013D1DB